jgi:molybdopterin molybdotransferase
MLSYEAARAKVMEVLGGRAGKPGTEIIPLTDHPVQACGRVLAEDIFADRNYPPFNRSTRDGFAVRSADAAQPGARLRLIGESRAGAAFGGTAGPGECVRILTGAPLPRGANAVVMQEYAHKDAEFVILEQPAVAGQNYVLAGAEARIGETVLRLGTRLGYAELAMAAQVGRANAAVTRRPRVAILCTGDEVVAADETPSPVQIRNSNCVSLAAQVALAGGEPIVLGIARDETAELRSKIEMGLTSDMFVLSGGVSVGKYDLVEQVLIELGAEFFFDAVAIRPGRPSVFGWCRGKPVFGLPGNPVSTMVTFELFVVPAIDFVSGCLPQPLPLFKARLAHPVNEKAELTHFLPARLKWLNQEPYVELLLWEGSGDIGAVVRGNCFLVVHNSRLSLEQDEQVDVLPRRDMF